MKQRKPLLAIAAFAVLALGLAGCNDTQPGPIRPAPGSTASATPTAPALGKAPVYKLPADMCTVANPAPFQDLYPGKPPTSRSTTLHAPSAGPSAAGICTIMFGGLDSSLGISVGAETHAQTGLAKEKYDYLRKRVFADYPNSAKDIPGLGDGAYIFSDDSVGGVRIVVLHGNAHNSIAVLKRGSATYPADVQQRLITITKDMLAKMPTE